MLLLLLFLREPDRFVAPTINLISRRRGRNLRSSAARCRRVCGSSLDEMDTPLILIHHWSLESRARERKMPKRMMDASAGWSSQ